MWSFDSAPLWEDAFVHLGLAAVRTSRIGLGTAVLIPSQRSVMAMASGLATISRLSGGRLRAGFGTGYTARMAVGQRAMPLDAFFDYVAAVRTLLAGETVVVDGKAVRMLHMPGLTTDRPVPVEIWLSVLGPRGNARAAEVADGILGPVHPSLPTTSLVSGTVLDEGEEPTSDRVRGAIGPWRVIPWHTVYATRGAAAVDAMAGGAQWRAALEALAPPEERHLLTFEGHVTHLTDRDRLLLAHMDSSAMVGPRDEIRERIHVMAEAGFKEALYTPSGPDVVRELRAFAAACLDPS